MITFMYKYFYYYKEHDCLNNSSYNEENYITETIENYINEFGKIIVINDGSKDNIKFLKL